MITAYPNLSEADEKVHIEIKGLQANSKITFHASLLNNKNRFESIGNYVANDEGKVDLETFPSLGGTYGGVKPMGFLWSMKPSLSNKYTGAFFRVVDIITPLDVHLRVYSGHFQDLSTFNADATKQCLYESVIQRRYLPDNVERTEYKTDKLRGVLFTPKGKGKYPGVLYVPGAMQGTNEGVSAFLAKNGFVVFAIIYREENYFIQEPFVVDLKKLENAVQFLTNHPKVSDTRGIGLSTISLGMQISLAYISYFKGVKCMYALNGEMVCGAVNYNYGDIRLLPTDRQTKVGDFCKEIFPIHRNKNTKISLTICTADKIQEIEKSIEIAEKVVKEHHMDNLSVVVYDKANHFIDLPYTLAHEKVWMRLFQKIMQFPCVPSEHFQSQLEIWKYQIKYFKSELQVNSAPTSKL